MRLIIYPDNTISLDDQPVHWGEEDWIRAGIGEKRVMRSIEGGKAWYMCSDCGHSHIPPHHLYAVGICHCGFDLDKGLVYVVFPTHEIVQRRHTRQAKTVGGQVVICCTLCGQEKPEDDFHKCNAGTFGRASRCKACRSVTRKEARNGWKRKAPPK